MIRYKNRPASIVAPVTPHEEAWYKITTENGTETVPQSQLQFDSKEDIKKFNEDYKTDISEDSVILVTEQSQKDLEETDKQRQEAASKELSPEETPVPYKAPAVEVHSQNKPKTVADVKKV